jgi:hypothetical protein
MGNYVTRTCITRVINHEKIRQEFLNSIKQRSSVTFVMLSSTFDTEILLQIVYNLHMHELMSFSLTCCSLYTLIHLSEYSESIKNNITREKYATLRGSKTAAQYFMHEFVVSRIGKIGSPLYALRVSLNNTYNDNSSVKLTLSATKQHSLRNLHLTLTFTNHGTVEQKLPFTEIETNFRVLVYEDKEEGHYFLGDIMHISPRDAKLASEKSILLMRSSHSTSFHIQTGTDPKWQMLALEEQVEKFIDKRIANVLLIATSRVITEEYDVPNMWNRYRFVSSPLYLSNVII